MVGYQPFKKWILVVEYLRRLESRCEREDGKAIGQEIDRAKKEERGGERKR